MRRSAVVTAQAPSQSPSDSRSRDRSHPIQAFGAILPAAIGLDERVRRDHVEMLHQLLADTLALRDLYKKHHWQTSGATVLPLHTLFDAHAHAQSELADVIAERMQTLGGVCIAVVHDVAERTRLARPPKDREAPGDQLRRLLQAHEVVLEEARPMARASAAAGDDGTSDLLVSQVIRTNELQSWMVAEHLGGAP